MGMTHRLKATLWIWVVASLTATPQASLAQTYLRSVPGEPTSPSSQNWNNSPENWRNNPNNWQNSSSNWQNTSQDWRNSPQNWANSAQNYNNANGIYDRNGNRIGYAVPRADGSGINYFDNSGRRTGYQNYEKR
jgi:hypothetical protein